LAEATSAAEATLAEATSAAEAAGTSRPPRLFRRRPHATASGSSVPQR
jgi:hypothetical protein